MEQMIAQATSQQREEIKKGACICEFPGIVGWDGKGVCIIHEHECLERRRQRAA